MNEETHEHVHEHKQAPADAPDARPSGVRIVLTACAFLLCFALAVAAMRWLTPGATLVVNARDKTAAALLKRADVSLHQIDGKMIHVLHQGRQSVRAGEYRIEVDNDDARLEFSTGNTVRIEKGDTLTIEVKGFPLE